MACAVAVSGGPGWAGGIAAAGPRRRGGEQATAVAAGGGVAAEAARRRGSKGARRTGRWRVHVLRPDRGDGAGALGVQACGDWVGAGGGALRRVRAAARRGGWVADGPDLDRAARWVSVPVRAAPVRGGEGLFERAGGGACARGGDPGSVEV